MLRSFTESLFDHLIRAFPPDRDYERTALEQAELPRPVAHFLVRTLQHRLDLEAEKLRAVRTAWFDYDHPAVEEAYTAFVATLAEHARIPQENWASTLKRALEQVAAHLVRPTETLVDFVFGDEHGVLALPRISERLGYFTAYPHLHEVVEAYFGQKQLREIDRVRFASLLDRIDREMTRDYDAEAWLRLLDPFFEVARAAYPDPYGGIPVELLQTFFSDKDVEGLQRRLRLAQEQGRENISEKDLREMLEAPAAPLETPPASTPAPAREPQPAASLPPAGPANPVPLWQQFQQSRPHLPAEGGGRPTPTPERSRSTPGRRPEPNARPLWMQFRSAPVPPLRRSERGSSSLLDLERVVLGPNGPRNRDLFVEHLFSGSSEEYERVLRRLLAAASWTQASQIIAQDVFRKHQVNIYSDPAIAFTDTVEAQYRRGRMEGGR